MARPSGPDWLDMATAPAGGRTGAKVACIADPARADSTPIEVGPTMRMPCERTKRVISCSGRAPGVGVAGVVSGDDHHRADPGLGAVADDAGQGLRRDRDEREIDRLRQVLHASGRRPPGDLVRGRVDRVHRPWETALDEVGEDLVPDGVRLPVRADHRDRRGDEQFLQRTARRPVLAAAHPGQRAGPLVDAEHHVLQVPLRGDRGISGGCEHAQHRRVGGEHVGLEHVDADRGSGRGEPLQQQRAEPHALELVGDGERHLGVVGVRQPDQPAHPDHPVIKERRQGEMVRVVHVHELAQQLAAEPGHRPEQALGQRAAGQPAAEIEHGLFVGGPHRPDEHRAAVPQQPGCSSSAG